MTELLRHDHVEWTTESLQERLGELHVNNKNIGYTGERLDQVRHEMGVISLELSCRYRDNKVASLTEVGQLIEHRDYL